MFWKMLVIPAKGETYFFVYMLLGSKLSLVLEKQQILLLRLRILGVDIVNCSIFVPMSTEKRIRYDHAKR